MTVPDLGDDEEARGVAAMRAEQRRRRRSINPLRFRRHDGERGT